jgi:preprotein translocase subunit SecB
MRNGTLYSYSLYDVSAVTRDNESAWEVKLEMVGLWDVADGTGQFDDEHLSCFALAIGSMTLHPYARENVQAAVSRMGYPPFTLDMLHPPTAGHDEDQIQLDASDS